MSNIETLTRVGIKDPSFDFMTISQLVKKGIIEKPLDGNHGEIHPKSEDFVNSGVPFIMASDIDNGIIDYSNCNFITRKQADSLRKGFAKNGDVLLTHKATIGRTAIVKYDTQPYVMLTPQVTYYRVLDSEKLNRHYLRYFFESTFFQETLSLWAGSGSTRAYLGITEQGKLPFVLPPIDKQKNIAAVLSPYDELIEINRQRIALLQKMAEDLYCEWFVRFRFEDYKNKKLVKGLPIDWSIVELNQVAFEASKGTRPGQHLANRYYLPLDMLASKGINPENHAEYSDAQSSLVTFEKNDILFGAMRPYQHKVCIAPFSGITRTTCFVIRAKKDFAWPWLYLTMFQSSTVDYATSICNGSDRPYTVWNKGMERMKIIKPDDHTLQRFNEIARPILNKISSMYFIQRKLKECRNFLLPRLISGQLSLENLDIKFAPSILDETVAPEINNIRI